VIEQAIILAGGKGTRLQSVVSDVPKPMAQIGEKPFLEHLLLRLSTQGLKKIILSVGYKKESILDHFGHEFKGLQIAYAEEDKPLGTGGAIMHALKYCDSNDVLIFNGDTYLDLDLNAFTSIHISNDSGMSLALKEISHPDRYGTVDIRYEKDGLYLASFNEKQTGLTSGIINAGVYAVKKSWLNALNLPEVFSFESEVLEKYVNQDKFGAYLTKGFFIDIGIPEDYRRAMAYFAMPQIDSDWTLFLDRDGVINERIVDDYVRSKEGFKFLPGALEAIAGFTKVFKRIIVVTNQQGVGKGLMQHRDVDEIHEYMVNQIENAGGKIDRVYYCPALHANNDPCRKPNPGMAFSAKNDFPDVDLSKSLMIGDSISDLEFAQNAGMMSAYIIDEPYKYELKLTDIHAINLLEIESYLRRS